MPYFLPHVSSKLSSTTELLGRDSGARACDPAPRRCEHTAGTLHGAPAPQLPSHVLGRTKSSTAGEKVWETKSCLLPTPHAWWCVSWNLWKPCQEKEICGRVAEGPRERTAQIHLPELMSRLQKSRCADVPIAKVQVCALSSSPPSRCQVPAPSPTSSEWVS